MEAELIFNKGADSFQCWRVQNQVSHVDGLKLGQTLLHMSHIFMITHLNRSRLFIFFILC